MLVLLCALVGSGLSWLLSRETSTAVCSLANERYSADVACLARVPDDDAVTLRGCRRRRTAPHVDWLEQGQGRAAVHTKEGLGYRGSSSRRTVPPGSADSCPPFDGSVTDDQIFADCRDRASEAATD